jgi:hypothetical protein
MRSDGHFLKLILLPFVPGSAILLEKFRTKAKLGHAIQRGFRMRQNIDRD